MGAARTRSVQLLLATISFTVCFAAWGLISAFAPLFREMFRLSATDTALLVSIPVVLGALGRIPMGMLADRFGARAVFPLLMLLSAVPALLVPQIGSHRELLGLGLLLGTAGSSFAVGVQFVSRWFPAERQGAALGTYGVGNIGQSAVVFLGPVLAAFLGWQNVFPGGRGAAGSRRVSLPGPSAQAAATRPGAGRRCAGGCTNAFSGDAYWQFSSHFRWFSAGFISGPCRRTR
jgi:nitrate/nitrite transporter NarK